MAMTIDEAVKRLYRNAYRTTCYGNRVVEHEENLIAIQALEKQISKKPTPIDYEKYIDIIDNARFLRGACWCPNCNHVVRSGSFCKDCGQKLDWSDEE